MALTAVLLAGGESRRMGRDKATALWRGRPLWEVQLEKLRTLRPAKILVSARTEPLWHPANVGLVLDETSEGGPISGLIAALNSLETDHLLVLAIDLPHMTTEHLSVLSGQMKHGRGIVPMVGERAEPVCAIYPKEAVTVFRRALSERQFSMQPLVRELIDLNMLWARPVLPEEELLYQNVNEPSDLE